MNRKFSLFSALGALALILSSTLAQAEKNFATWRKYTSAELVSETTALAPGQPGALGLKIKLADRWHAYWVNPGDAGMSIRVKFSGDAAVKILRVLHPIPERQMTGPLVSFGYSKEVLLPIEVLIAPDAKPGTTLRLEAEVDWLICQDVCIPANDKLKLEIPLAALGEVKPSSEFALFQRTRRLLPEPQSEYPQFVREGGAAILKLPLIPDEEEYVDFFPFKGAGVTAAAAKFSGGNLEFALSNVPAVAKERVGLLVLKVRANQQLRALQFGESGWTYESKSAATEAQGIWWMLVSAFLGGLILNLMPCVFPILSMKLLGLLKLGKAHVREVRAQNLAYVGGVLISFLSIALILSMLRTAGTLVGWGFQLQSPVFLALLSWLFFALSLNLMGLYEIDFINSDLGGKWTRGSGLWGSFFTGVLAVIVASPCTAPFMGAALGFGLSQSTPVLVAIFLTLGLGLAFPYIMFVIAPSLLVILPRPGAWMNTLKKVMAVPMFATTFWMMWVLQQVRGTPAVAVVLSVSAVLGLALWGPLRGRARMLVNTVAVLALAGGLAFIYSSQAQVVEHVDDGIWQAYSDGRLAELRGKNVFVNMTADWCLTCKVNERLVFSHPEVQALLKAKQVIALKGDWTQRNEQITRFLNGYNRVGVPFYVLFSKAHPEGLPLPEVITKNSFIEYINAEFP